jgi:GNAT superfamily N-acetyltransferase
MLTIASTGASIIEPSLSQLTPVEIALPNGTMVALRPLIAEDRENLADGFERLSAESRYRRFMTPTTRLTLRELTYFSELDYRDHFAWGIQVVTEAGLDGAGVARYVRFPEEGVGADTAFTVLDEYQGQGIGQVLFMALAIAGRVNDIERFHFDVLAENRPMLGVLRKFGVSMDPISEGLTQGVLEIAPFVDDLDSWPPAEPLAGLVEGARHQSMRH